LQHLALYSAPPEKDRSGQDRLGLEAPSDLREELNNAAAAAAVPVACFAVGMLLGALLLRTKRH